MANRLSSPNIQFLDNQGEPLAGGYLYFYVTTTSTPTDTYNNEDLAAQHANANPIQLDAAGRAGDVFLDPTITYKLVLEDSTHATLWTADPVVDIAANINAKVQIYAGDPNGNVAGDKGTVGSSGASMVWDSIGHSLYVCTTTGNAAAAVWTSTSALLTGAESIKTNDYLVLPADNGLVLVANKGSSITFSLTTVATIGTDFIMPVKNIGAGVLTLDPAGVETIDGAVTYTMAQYDSAVLYCNGATWRILSVYKASTASSLRGYLYGLTLSNGTDAVNDINIAAGEATDTTFVDYLTTGALVKRLDAAWAVGTGNGGLDTGSIGDKTYHIYLIKRLDTGVVDAIFSASAGAPTLPANYTIYRRIGSVIRASGSMVLFSQVGDCFMRKVPINDANVSGPSDDTAVSLTCSVPVGIKVDMIGSVYYIDNGADTETYLLIESLDQTNTQPTATVMTVAGGMINNAGWASTEFIRRTNTSAQIRYRINPGTVDHLLVFTTHGWYDRRGRDE